MGKKRSPLVLLLLLLLWSVCLGWGMAMALAVTSPPLGTNIGEVSQSPPLTNAEVTSGGGTVDPVPNRYKLGQELYLENCSTCHIALPPPVLPNETWRNLLEDEQHYGMQLQPLIGPSALIMWEYLRTFSRPHKTGERVPYRISESRYFRAIHPQVKLPQNVKIASCVTCHPSAAKFNFRRLTPEWENSAN